MPRARGWITFMTASGCWRLNLRVKSPLPTLSERVRIATLIKRCNVRLPRHQKYRCADVNLQVSDKQGGANGRSFGLPPKEREYFGMFIAGTLEAFHHSKASDIIALKQPAQNPREPRGGLSSSPELRPRFASCDRKICGRKPSCGWLSRAADKSRSFVLIH